MSLHQVPGEPVAPEQWSGSGPNSGENQQLYALFADTARSYDLVVKLATLGMDWWWKYRLMQVIPTDREFHRILDLGCGTGISTLKLADRYPNAEVVGIDLMKSYLDVAAEKLRDRKTRNIELIHMRIEDMRELSGEFDLVVGSFIPKLVDTDRLAEGCDAKISSGGVVILHDFIVPTTWILRLGFRAYWLVVKSFMRLVRGWGETSQNLFRIIWESNWQQDVQRKLATKGFTDFYYETQPLQVSRILRAVRPA